MGVGDRERDQGDGERQGPRFPTFLARFYWLEKGAGMCCRVRSKVSVPGGGCGQAGQCGARPQGKAGTWDPPGPRKMGHLSKILFLARQESGLTYAHSPSPFSTSIQKQVRATPQIPCDLAVGSAPRYHTNGRYPLKPLLSTIGKCHARQISLNERKTPGMLDSHTQ